MSPKNLEGLEAPATHSQTAPFLPYNINDGFPLFMCRSRMLVEHPRRLRFAVSSSIDPAWIAVLTDTLFVPPQSLSL